MGENPVLVIFYLLNSSRYRHFDHQEAFLSCIQVQMQLQKLKEGPTIAQTTSSEMLRKALSEKQIKRNGKIAALTSINKKVTYY